MMILLLATAWQTQAVAGDKPPKAKIFRSRAAVEKALGEKLVEQVPSEFDFQLYSLVRVQYPVDKVSAVKIVTLPSDQKFEYSRSPDTKYYFTRRSGAVKVFILLVRPCVGGHQPPPGQQEKCIKRMEAGLETARHTEVLFATRRAALKRVVVRQRRAPPRP